MDTAEKLTQIQGSSFPKAKDICFASEANELYFGVVGHVGSGTGFIARKLKDILSGPSRGYEVEVISASKAIRKWSEKNGKTDIPSDDGVDSIIKTERLQTLGDDMRDSTDDYAAVAQGIIDLIRIKRGEWTPRCQD
ncbi:MAG: hypothetical protein RBS05_22000, partial [Zoogloea oleivorans]|uniref:hypothetical protein n=1 Tax=Zoogloea oleivorans TaxID=1552750 RepID=UPI002A35FAE1